MSRKRIIVRIVITLLGCVGFWIFQKKHQLPQATEVPERPKLVSLQEMEKLTLPSVIAMQPPKQEELAKTSPHPLAAAIGSPNLTAEREIAGVLELFQAYRQMIGSVPAGETNAEFMNALRGNNRLNMPFFPYTHPRLDAEGNLLDRWGQPYIFHAVSRERLEIRSKGPDQQIYTADDLVVPDEK